MMGAVVMQFAPKAIYRVNKIAHYLSSFCLRLQNWGTQEAFHLALLCKLSRSRARYGPALLGMFVAATHLYPEIRTSFYGPSKNSIGSTNFANRSSPVGILFSRNIRSTSAVHFTITRQTWKAE